jgi:restriction endonuclease Mrr
MTAEGHATEEIREQLKAQFKITPEEAQQTHAKSEKNIFVNLVAWALAYLVMGKLIERKDDGVYRITERGSFVLKGNPSELVISDLH